MVRGGGRCVGVDKSEEYWWMRGCKGCCGDEERGLVEDFLLNSVRLLGVGVEIGEGWCSKDNWNRALTLFVLCKRRS